MACPERHRRVAKCQGFDYQQTVDQLFVSFVQLSAGGFEAGAQLVDVVDAAALAQPIADKLDNVFRSFPADAVLSKMKN